MFQAGNGTIPIRYRSETNAAGRSRSLGGLTPVTALSHPRRSIFFGENSRRGGSGLERPTESDLPVDVEIAASSTVYPITGREIRKCKTLAVAFEWTSKLSYR